MWDNFCMAMVIQERFKWICQKHVEVKPAYFVNN